MIDSVRNTVLAVLNKNNYGYLSPSDFNLFAKQAQLDIFKDYIYQYNYQINKENARQSGTEHADIRQSLENVIDFFVVSRLLPKSTGNKYFLPSIEKTGDSAFKIDKVICYLTDDGTSIQQGEAEFVSNHRIPLLKTSATKQFPMYSMSNGFMNVYPSNIYNVVGAVECIYTRYPLDPKWTYVSMLGGEPLFDPSQSDYQDFELPDHDEPKLVAKILQYSGLSIREMDVYNFSKGEEVQTKQEEA